MAGELKQKLIKKTKDYKKNMHSVIDFLRLAGCDLRILSIIRCCVKG